MRRAVLLATVFLAVAPAHAALAQSAATPAPASELARSVSIPFEEFTLDNGLRVVVHTDRKAPVVAVAAWYNVGSKDERAGRTGFAHLFEHIGLFNPTENLPGGLMEPLRAIGATDWNGTTWFDRTNFFQTVPTSALEQALYMESDRMGHLLGALNQERLDNQRGVVQNEKRQGDNQPYGLVEYAQLDALFPEGHPYRHSTIGSMADLDAASLEDLRQWHRDNYGPNNAVLVLAGDVDAAEARRLVEKYFGDIPRGAVNEPAQADVPTLPARIDKTLHDRVSNTRLYRTWIVPGLLDDSAADLDVAATVFGGLASSRLDNAMVRGDQTATAVTASYQPFHRIGMFEASVDVKPGEDPAAVAARLDQLIADFVASGPTEDEVKRVVTTRMSQRIQALEPVGGFTGKAVVLAEGELYADDPGHYRRELAAYGEVTPDSVRAVMNRWLTRPVLALRVDPGEREPYAEAASTRPAPTPPAPLTVVPREPMPGVTAMKALDFPDVERATLSNGLEVVYARSTTVPVTRVAVEFDAGVAADPRDALGTQRLMLDLLTEGTANRNAVQLAEEQERLGAAVNAFATVDRTVVSLTAVSANLAPSLDLLADVIRNPAFAPADIERRRDQQLAAIAQEQTSPNGMGLRALPAILYGDQHPYGRPFSGLGDPDAVSGLDRDDLTTFHARWIRPDNARVFVVSDKPLAELKPMLDARFGAWVPPASARAVKAFDAPIPAARPRIVLIDRPQSPQSLILGGLVLPVTGQDDVVTLNAANEVIGNGFLSRINQDIRETRGWSYGLNGRVNLLEKQTPYIITAPVQSDRTGESIAVLIDQYKGFLGDRGVTAAERERTVNGNVRQLPGSFETSTAVLNALRSNALYGRPDNYWETLAPRYEGLSAAQMDAAAREIIDSGDIVWVVVGDASVVKPQLEALGLEVEVRPAS
ncbi:M16 family metallopeptidase [Brevundimonas sp. Root1279]|uniref:M16 family metallopeptidase n=1 Tax=Brevundimonas sp. Root1279 TaxID=1736443 RepID=UPI0007023741|nr:pitrilysin family protein [Brevundimonas sp. Root1279]KQW86747.1 peptidase M16 [Brevundimonas sp. Root1279]